MTLREFQSLIRRMYHDKDAARGVEGTFMWLTEEIGELSTALRNHVHGAERGAAAHAIDALACLRRGEDMVDEAMRIGSAEFDARRGEQFGRCAPGFVEERVRQPRQFRHMPPDEGAIGVLIA